MQATPGSNNFRELAGKVPPLLEREKGLSLVELAHKARHKAGDTLGGKKSGAAAHEVNETNDLLPDYAADFSKLPPESNPDNYKWEQVRGLLLKNIDKLTKVQELVGGGQLFYIDSKGIPYFKDRTTEPVRFLKVKGVLQPFTDSDHIQSALKKGAEWTTEDEIRAYVKNTDFRLFKHDGSFNQSDLMDRAAVVNEGGFFLGNPNKKTPLRSVLETGSVDLYPMQGASSGIDISFTRFNGELKDLGAIRYLKFDQILGSAPSGLSKTETDDLHQVSRQAFFQYS